MAFKLKFRTLFPASVTASSPLTLVKTGLSYVLGLSITDLRTSLDPFYQPIIPSGGVRTRLVAATDFFVRTDGSDSNTGLANTVGGAFLTVNGALAKIATTYDLNRNLVQVRVQGGTYSGNVFLPQWLGYDAVNGFNQFKVIGENGTVTMTSPTASPCIFGTRSLAPITFENITFTNPAASGQLIYMDDYGFVSLKTCVLGATGAGGIKVNSVLLSNVLLQNSTFQIAGDSGVLFNAANYGLITCQPGCVFNASGAVTYATAVVQIDSTSALLNGSTSFTGTVPTGSKYSLAVPGKITDVSTIAGSGAPSIAPLIVGNGGTGVITSTGSGANVLGTGPTLDGATLATKLIKGVYIIDASAVRLTLTGTVAKTTMKTIAVPANSLGANGRLRITVQYGKTGVTDTWSPRVEFGGTIFGDLGPFAATNPSARTQFEIVNRNATNSQVGSSATQANWSQNTASVVTAAIDTTSAQNILLTGQLANVADTLAIEYYLVELIVP